MAQIRCSATQFNWNLKNLSSVAMTNSYETIILIEENIGIYFGLFPQWITIYNLSLSAKSILHFCLKTDKLSFQNHLKNSLTTIMKFENIKETSWVAK